MKTGMRVLGSLLLLIAVAMTYLCGWEFYTWKQDNILWWQALTQVWSVVATGTFTVLGIWTLSEVWV